jgi:predicted PurR-regulated permease PerM
VQVTDDDSLLKPSVDPMASAEPVGAAAAKPDLERTVSTIATMRVLSLSTTIVAVLALIYTAQAARAFLLPIAFAILLNFLLSPLVRALGRLHVPTAAAAAFVVLAMLAILGLGAYELAGPVQRWAVRAPVMLQQAQEEVVEMIRPLQRASATAEEMASAASGAGDSAAGGGERPQEVVVQGPSLVSRAFGTTKVLVAGALEVVVLLYFLLAGGELFLQKLVKVLPNLGDKKKAVQIARDTEASISRYLVTAFLVNLGEACIVAVIMHLWGMPNPLLWGALVLGLEFIPYLGALVMVVLLAIAALVTFDTAAHALLVPASFLVVNLVQGNFVSPILLGHRLSLNPVALFVGLAFWFTVWGLPGAFMAVPMMATLKILCDHIESLASVGEFLGGRDDDERRASVRSA